MGYIAKNNARAQLAGILLVGDLTANLDAGKGALFAVTAPEYTYATLFDGAGNIEHVKVTARATDALTIVRAQDGTAAREWPVGTYITCRPIAAALADYAVAPQINTATAETSIADADEIGFVDASASNVLKKITWANALANIQTLLESVFRLISDHVTLAAGKTIIFEGTADDAYETTLTAGDPTADRTITLPDLSGKVALEGNDYTAAAPATGDYIAFSDASDSNLPKKATIAEILALMGSVPVRQTVLSGPVDSSGLPNFGGSTGSTTVTATGTLKATAAAGGDANYTGSIVDPSWTGLSTNGTMYLYLDITSAGVVTTGSTALAPVYQWGGTYSTINGQNTFNIQEMTMKAGNGSAASQVTRVFVGEATVSGGVVTAITWYALMGRTEVVGSALQGNTQVTAEHKLGLLPRQWDILVRFTAANLGYASGDEISVLSVINTSYQQVVSRACSKTSLSYVVGAGTPCAIYKNSTSLGSITLADTAMIFRASRGW